MNKIEIEKKLKALAKRGNISLRVDNNNGFFVLLRDNDFVWSYVQSEGLYIFALGNNRDKAVYAKAESIKTTDVDAGRIEIVL